MSKSAIFNCPRCGWPLKVKAMGQAVRESRGTAFSFELPGQKGDFEPPGQELIREEPARPASIESDVKVPLLQSLVSGGFAALAGGAATMAFGWPWWAPALAGGGVAAFSWLVLMTDARSLLRKTWCVATSPAFYEPAERKEIIRLEITEPEQKRMIFLDLPIDAERLQIFARGALRGSLTEAAWTGYGRPFTRGEFHALRDKFITQGWLAWRSPSTPARGVVLTPQGKAVMRYLAGEKD